MSSSTTEGRDISYDVVIQVIEWLSGDYFSLHSCSLVNRKFRDASGTLLYRNVTYSPEYNPEVNLRERDELSLGFFASARLPHNAALVRRLEVGGFLSERPLLFNKFPKSFQAAVGCWPNLHIVVLKPRRYHAGFFDNALPLLLQLPLLRHLTLNALRIEDEHARTIAKLRHLKTLILQNPSRATLQMLPNWLGELGPTLWKFHLTQNCGSVTPGVLRSFAPVLQGATSFALGLSYSLTDDDVFDFLASVLQIRVFAFRYYPQLRPSRTPCLPHLRKLTILYIHEGTRDGSTHFRKWIRRVISSAPLESLHLDQGPRRRPYGAMPNYDHLLDSLSARHATTLRVLNMPWCFVGKRSLKSFCENCTHLEELGVAVRKETINDFATYSASLSQLKVVRFGVLRARKWKATIELARTIIRPDSSILRLEINGTQFLGRYEAQGDGAVKLVVEIDDAKPHLFSWEKAVVYD